MTGVWFGSRPRVIGPLPEGVAPEDIWWRAEDRTYGPFDEWGDCVGSYDEIHLIPHLVERRTPKGVWVRRHFGGPVFVLGTAAKQEAVPTKELALADLVARKKRHADFAEARAANVRRLLAIAERALEEEKNL